MVEWLAWRFGLRHEQAEDAAKDAIVKAYERRHTYNPTRASLRTLLFRIAENVAIDHHRKHRREIKFSEKDDSEDSSSFEERLIDKTEMSPEQALMETVARENRRRVIDVLSPTSRQIFDLWQDKGYKPKEIADVLGISVKDVNRMQQQLRREFPQCMERLNLSEEDLI
jgi:RNA polymerase sigma-70 factor (ECF subfamily)